MVGSYNFLFSIPISWYLWGIFVSIDLSGNEIERSEKERTRVKENEVFEWISYVAN